MSKHTTGFTRRCFLAGAGTVAVVSLSGCLGTSEEMDPVSIESGQNCDQCGMVIDQHPGPAGQTYYQNNSPEGHDPPARFCSTTCTYRHRFAKEQSGWTPAETFLTDYSTRDYETQTDGGKTIISRHLGREAFASTERLTVVANSEVEGAMGTAIVPFSDSGDAESFAEEHGGQTLPAEEISRELVGGM
ncbi:nitrous oxide reductase accessory protein NosL [Haloarcula taiwanensis]|uniref:Nitrous oxide reductase accessory protein NosL n=1 Tax=Haloarcula taiwanensis TaxID=1932004 RepID=A0A2H5A2Q7_9EURY|nr:MULTISPECIES: nitrous oxide reductase accessory protein NosL [Haloarcula]AUG49028.1 nitrous oxide reductase accessory protein NosL [Haloarcula taiwanensis]RLM34821.1 nitrous oxide reductase accessory protein NosL [Haloarcula sp. Atlit-120R]RLM44235.1 nitrous oxide reductase accessory protein NosL [Haloarcula sp. Atlit-47R]RLM90513.1 nitrous oxide reductase accessory protein NosL [Haloarcula sp. Atlit-7R]